MQIQLTQPEIVIALKQYIERKGISLHGKEVDVKFGYGRKNNTGVSVDVSIEDAGIPEFEDADGDQAKAPATVTPIRAVDAAPAVAEPTSGDAPAPELKTAGASLFS